MITQLRNKETGFSLLELSVAVGIAAIVAAGAITATTTFIGSAQDKRDDYTANADNAIEAAESSSIALGAEPTVEEELVSTYSSSDWTSASFEYNPSFANGSHAVFVGASTTMKNYLLDNTPTSASVTHGSGTDSITVESVGYDSATDSLWFILPGVEMDGKSLYSSTITNIVFN